jgi:dihydrofolate reductase
MASICIRELVKMNQVDEKIPVALIVAMANNRVIGRNNALPWHLSEDLKYFKRVTLGKPVIMGRKTFESIGRPLPGRANIVVSRSGFVADNVQVVGSLEAALELAGAIAEVDGASEIMVIGGAQLYAHAIPLAQRLYLTLVDAEIEGDAWFPELDMRQWRELAREDHAPLEPNPYPYSFRLLERCAG